MKKTIVIFLVIAMVGCLCACGGPKEVTDLQYTATIGNEEYSGVFTGTVIDKIPNGEGTFTFSGPEVNLTYSGQWENGVLVGAGHLEYDGFAFEYNGETYVGSYSGEAVNGVPNGEGTFTSSDSEANLTYSGQWESGALVGVGNLEYGSFVLEYNGETYVGSYSGETVDGVPNGAGSFNASSEEGYINYTGSWTDGVFSGDGYLESDLYVVHFLDGVDRMGEYKGDLLDGLPSGSGTFTAVNDAGVRYTYTGEWKNGLYNGFGKATFDAFSNVHEGNFKDGEFAPTPLQFFVALGTGDDDGYEITDNAVAFLEKYPDVFINNTTENTDIEFEENFKYEAFAKNPAKFGEKLIKISGLRVVQIFEYSDWGYDYSFCIAQDSNYNVYYIYLLGYADDVYEGSRVTLTALPLAYFTYPNTAGNKIWAIACAAVSIG